MIDVDAVLKRIVKQLDKRDRKPVFLTQEENDALIAKFPAHVDEGLFHSPRLTRAGVKVQIDGRQS